MSRQKKWWGYAKYMISDYPDELNENERRAVERAIEQTRRMAHGEERLKVIDLLYWRKTHKIPGAALQVHYSERTVLQWNGEFIKLVAENFSCDGLAGKSKK